MSELVKTIDAYTNPATTSKRTTEYSYDGNGNTLRLKAVLPSSGEQVTRWIYGIVTGDGNDLNSNDLVKEVQHPHKTTGAADPTERDILTYNALGERKTFKDRLATTHSYRYDVVGRFQSDAVTAFGLGVNETVKRLEVSYDSAGRPHLFSSYNAATGGSVVNQVRRDYTGLGELASEYQAHTGAVSVGVTPGVGYAYSFAPSGTANHSRPDYFSYPNGRYQYLSYGTAGGLNDTISRLSALVDSDTVTTLESYTYLGLGTVVKRAHPQPDVDLTYIKQTGESNGPQGDQYNGLDQFGRVVDQRWRKGDGTHTDRFGYGYDANSNRLYRENLLGGTAAAFSELYAHPTDSSGYDDLDQVRGFKRGTLNGTKTDVTEATPARRQRWTSLDIMGNWTTFDQWTGATQTTENRTHNKQNQLTAINSTTLTYDANGNLKEDEQGRDFVYDAWNRVTQVAGTSTLNYTYDALNRRITESVVSPALTKDLYYSSAWQLLEERHDGLVKLQYVWSPVYVDALVLRDRDTGTDQVLDERLYVQQDANWNVTAVVSTAGAVQERYVYDPYGVPTRLSAGFGTPGDDTLKWQYLHQGGRYEAATGLYDFRMRPYSATLGRWVTEDPIGFAAGDTNLVRYVHNMPTNRIDPSGLAVADPNAVHDPTPLPAGYDPSRPHPANLDLTQHNERLRQCRMDAFFDWKYKTAPLAFIRGFSEGAVMTANGITFRQIKPLDKVSRELQQEYGDTSYYAGNVATLAIASIGGIWTWRALGNLAIRINPQLTGTNLQWHHIWPRYLSYPPPWYYNLFPGRAQVLLPSGAGSIHQAITNAFQQALPWQGVPYTTQQIAAAMVDIYRRFPIDGFPYR